TLLTTVAAIALTAASLASAQTQNRGNAPAAAPAASPSTQGAPAETQATPEHGPAAKPGANKGARESAPPSQKTTQQPSTQQPSKGTAQSEHEQKAQPRSSQSETKQPAPGAAQNNQATSNRSMTTSNVSLTTEQKTTIRTKVLTSSAPRVTGHVNFDIKVGVVVPRTIRVAPVPVELVEIEPRWRGFLYFVNGDEIIVVEPGTLRIVAVIDV